ncbi:MAG: hypothetical protein U0841_11920 [Chloroflexia bacterium]
MRRVGRHGHGHGGTQRGCVRCRERRAVYGSGSDHGTHRDHGQHSDQRRDRDDRGGECGGDTVRQCFGKRGGVCRDAVHVGGDRDDHRLGFGAGGDREGGCGGECVPGDAGERPEGERAVRLDDTAQKQRWSNLPQGLYQRAGLMWGNLSDASAPPGWR